MNSDLSSELQDRVSSANSTKEPLNITAGESKAFYGHNVDGEKLDVSGHSGIIDYRASELVITARSGTKLTDVEAALHEQGQQIAFEPPRHNENATIGGTVACGLSGPGRPFFGAARDFVLGAKIINGRGELMQFGGQVMKNVAGYDLSRLMVGAQGTLGVILEVSVKVLPKAETESTLAFEINAADGHRMLRDWLGAGHPITASCHYQGVLSVRLSSTENSVGEAARKLGGEAVSNQLWQQLRDQSHPCFRQEGLWRLSLPPAAVVDTEVEQLIEWGGALRWQVAGSDLFERAQRLGGHATRYQMTPDRPEKIFQPLQPGMLAIQKRIKHALDPANILNPGRLYPEL
jgi:glycolate oxidase FAD binding subunit